MPAKVLLEQVDPCVQTAVEFGEEAHWAGEIGLTQGWSSLTFSVFSKFFLIWSHYSCRGARRVPLPARNPPAGGQLGGGRKILNLFC